MKSLINWELDDKALEYKVLPISRNDIESMIDIVRAISCTFTISDNLDFSYFNEKKDNCKLKVGINADNVPYYSILVKYYLNDSKAFTKPTTVRSNNVGNDVFEQVAATIFFEKIGVVDVPDRPPLQHSEITSKVFSKGVTKKTEYPGITILLRRVDYASETAIYYLTALASINHGTATLWSVKIIIPELGNPGEIADAKLYFTFPTELIDQVGTVN